MSDQWGPWIEHDGNGCPCVGMYVEVDHETGFGLIIPKVDGRCGWNGKIRDSNVIRYRIRKPKGLKILEALLQNLPDTVDA